nr:MAG TPA_asm: hypothetical protein [Caudoviricetes sp.]
MQKWPESYTPRRGYKARKGGRKTRNRQKNGKAKRAGLCERAEAAPTEADGLRALSAEKCTRGGGNGSACCAKR